MSSEPQEDQEQDHHGDEQLPWLPQVDALTAAEQLLPQTSR